MSQGKASDLNQVGGNSTLVNTVKTQTRDQLDAVAVNSGIISGPVNMTNTFPVDGDNRYKVRTQDMLDPKGGNALTTSVSDDSYTNK